MSKYLYSLWLVIAVDGSVCRRFRFSAWLLEDPRTTAFQVRQETGSADRESEIGGTAFAPALSQTVSASDGSPGGDRRNLRGEA